MPKINHKLLEELRANAELSLDEAARKLGIENGVSLTRAEKLGRYESGEKDPSSSLLRRMAKQYRRPLLTFYLDQVPFRADRGEDFRTLPDEYNNPQEMFLVDTLTRTIKARQQVLRESLIDAEDDANVEFIGSHSTDDGVNEVASSLRKTLGFKLEDYRSCSTASDAFRYLRELTESAGVFVILQSNLGNYLSNISVTAFRGFALSDDIAPLVVINRNDAKSAWPFTLMHELAHLALGVTGVSGRASERSIEKFCNSVASEFLLPAKKFSVDSHDVSNADAVLEVASLIARDANVSAGHVAYRLYLDEKIDRALWQHVAGVLREQWTESKKADKARNSKKEGGPNYYVIKRQSLGAVVGLAERYLQSGILSTTKAGMLLDVRPLKVDRLFNVSAVS